MIILIRFHYTEYQRQNESDFFTLLTKNFSKFSGTHKSIILRNKNFQLLMPQAGIYYKIIVGFEKCRGNNSISTLSLLT